jgi:transposase
MARVPERVELDLDELKRIVVQDTLTASDREKLMAAVETLAFLTQALENKRISLARMRKIIFGASTEKTSSVCGQSEAQSSEHSTGADAQASESDSSQRKGETPDSETEKPKRKGHGRNGASRYHGAERESVRHASLCPGDGCPICQAGKLYELTVPARLVRLRGQAPITGKIWELQRLRCNTCGEVFTAEPPDGVGNDKYDVTASAMVGISKYGIGVPFNRLAGLENGMGIPLPPGTQWQILTSRIAAPKAVHGELIRIAAQGDVVHNDDTGAKILAMMKSRQTATKDDTSQSDERTGTFTSGIVAIRDGIRIALFFTGSQHAGENLADVLKHRPSALGAPIQMCDALSRNLPKEFKTILANCMAHARRNFVDVFDNFRDECRHVLEVLRDVYRNDQVARERDMSPEQRLAWHQAESATLMRDLEEWLKDQIDKKKVEPNGGLGQAIKYMQKHWHALTQFLRVAGAPLDNNICERILKKAILHRKNAYFFKTLRGAEVGDIFMSIIHTAELCRASPFDYLCAIMRNVDRVLACPSQWLPWNYQLALASG